MHISNPAKLAICKYRALAYEKGMEVEHILAFYRARVKGNA